MYKSGKEETGPSFKTSLQTSNQARMYTSTKTSPKHNVLMGTLKKVETQILIDFLSQIYFLFQLPRFGKEKVFPGIYVPAELDISEILAHGQPICCICKNAAILRCRECTLKKSCEKFSHDSVNDKLTASITTLCQTCFDMRHETKPNHHTENLQTWEHF